MASFPPTAQDVWTLQPNADDYAVLTSRAGTLRNPVVYVQNPSGTFLGGDEDPSTVYLPTQVVFRAGLPGTYRAIVTHPRAATDFGTYSIRIDRLTTPSIYQVGASVLGSAVSLFWQTDSPAPILQEVVLVGSAPGSANLGQFAAGPRVFGATRSSGLFQGSAPPGTYYVKIRAFNQWGFTDSPEQRLVVGPHLSPPGELLLSSVIGRRVVLSWSPPATPGATYYEVAVGSAPGLSTLATYDVGNVLTVSADGVPPGVCYVRVRAGNAQGPGAESNEVVVTVL